MTLKKRRTLAVLLAAALSALIVIPLTSCNFFKAPKKLGFLKAEGALVLNEKNQEVYLRGVNAGGLFVTEHWMTGFLYGKTPSNDYRSLTKTFIDRFGEEKTKALWAEYRANWWTEQDFKNCADMGMNVIRLPFTYMNVDFDAITDYKNAGKNYDFTDLDAFVEKAAEYGMYTVLDLHGAYGSQNGKDHSGEIIADDQPVNFYTDEAMMNLTADLWGALSTHYKNNANVAGYDILNEPGEHAGSTGELHWKFYDKVYKAIRATGDKHIVIFESCWNGENLPKTSLYGWKNCMYSFHHYAGDKLTNSAYKLNWNEKIADVTAQNFGVPLYMGEFTNYGVAENWDYTLDLLNRSNWHWTSWSYKVWGSRRNGATGNTPWGIINIMGNDLVDGVEADKIDASADSYETILEKFKKLRTDSSSAKKYTFNQSGGRTLESIFAEYCSAPAQTQKLAAGSYKLICDEGVLSVCEDNAVKLTEEYNSGLTFKLTYHSSGDGSAYLSYNGKYLCADASGKLTLKVSKGNDARFYPVETGYGWAFVSYSACRYLTVGADGSLSATALKVGEAAVFYI